MSEMTPSALLAQAATAATAADIHRLAATATALADGAAQRLEELRARSVDPTVDDDDAEDAAADRSRLNLLHDRYRAAAADLHESFKQAMAQERAAEARREYASVVAEREETIAALRRYPDLAREIADLLARVAFTDRRITAANRLGVGPHLMPVEGEARHLSQGEINGLGGSLLDTVYLPWWRNPPMGPNFGAMISAGMWMRGQR